MTIYDKWSVREEYGLVCLTGELIFLFLLFIPTNYTNLLLQLIFKNIQCHCQSSYFGSKTFHIFNGGIH